MSLVTSRFDPMILSFCSTMTIAASRSSSLWISYVRSFHDHDSHASASGGGWLLLLAIHCWNPLAVTPNAPLSFPQSVAYAALLSWLPSIHVGVGGGSPGPPTGVPPGSTSCTRPVSGLKCIFRLPRVIACAIVSNPSSSRSLPQTAIVPSSLYVVSSGALIYDGSCRA